MWIQPSYYLKSYQVINIHQPHFGKMVVNCIFLTSTNPCQKRAPAVLVFSDASATVLQRSDSLMKRYSYEHIICPMQLNYRSRSSCRLIYRGKGQTQISIVGGGIDLRRNKSFPGIGSLAEVCLGRRYSSRRPTRTEVKPRRSMPAES
jgi:hypothetical protein